MIFEKCSILVIDDNVSFSATLAELLEMECYQVKTAASGTEAMHVLETYHPHLIVSDIMLPDISGNQLLKRIQNEIGPIPYLFLSGKIQDADIVLGLEQGAEDYITKPFRPGELLARIRKILQRHTATEKKLQSPVLKLDGVSVLLETHQAYFQEKDLELTVREFELLHYLLVHAGQICTRKQMIERLWENDFNISDRIVDSHISNLREKLIRAGSRPDLIQTVRGVGYQIRK